MAPLPHLTLLWLHRLSDSLWALVCLFRKPELSPVSITVNVAGDLARKAIWNSYRQILGLLFRARLKHRANEENMGAQQVVHLEPQLVMRLKQKDCLSSGI